MVDAPNRPPVGAGSGLPGEDLSEYGVVVTGLRMATNYTFSVSPFEGRLQQPGTPYARNRHARTIMAPTKGCKYACAALGHWFTSYWRTDDVLFSSATVSARATLCLPDVSEVEVHTGPHFSGRIAVEANEGNSIMDLPPSSWRPEDLDEGVEGARGRGRGRGLGGPPEVPGSGDEPCAVAGDASSPRESYTLRIDHRRCGSHVNRSTVATFILVQENLPILTHSTRRFLVLCTFQPDALIVRAG